MKNTLITRPTADHEKARLELENLETHDTNLRRRVRELIKQVSSLDEVLKNTPIAEAYLRRLTDYIEIKHNVITLEVRGETKNQSSQIIITFPASSFNPSLSVCKAPHCLKVGRSYTCRYL